MRLTLGKQRSLRRCIAWTVLVGVLRYALVQVCHVEPAADGNSEAPVHTAELLRAAPPPPPARLPPTVPVPPLPLPPLPPPPSVPPPPPPTPTPTPLTMQQKSLPPQPQPPRRETVVEPPALAPPTAAADPPPTPVHASPGSPAGEGPAPPSGAPVRSVAAAASPKELHDERSASAVSQGDRQRPLPPRAAVAAKHGAAFALETPSPRAETPEPAPASRSGQLGSEHPAVSSQLASKTQAATDSRSSTRKSHGGEHFDATRGVFNWGTRTMVPAPVSSTMWIGYHEHHDGDAAREHAVAAPVDSSTIHFRNLTKETAIVAWAAPNPGLYGWDILGYRVQWRLDGQPWPAHDPASGVAVTGGSTDQGGVADVMTLIGSPSTGTDYTSVLVKTYAGVGIYHFRLRPWNHGGAGAWSEASYGLWPPTPPEPPTQLSAQAISGSVSVSNVSSAIVSGLNVSWHPSVTEGTAECADVIARDVLAGICTTVGAGLPIDSYKLEILVGTPTGTTTDHWQGAVRLSGLQRGVMPSAPGILGSVHLLVDPAFKLLLSNTVYSLRVSAHNGAGWSQPTAAVSVTTLGPPARPGSVQYTETARDFLRLVWPAPTLAADGSLLCDGNPVLRYRAFGSSWNPRMNLWEAATRYTLTSDTKRPYAASRLATRTPRPASLSKDEWLELFFGWEGDSATPDSSGLIHYLVDYLSPETQYRFVVVAVSASGESLPSLPSVLMATLMAAPKDIRAFIGAPCVYNTETKPVEFLAMGSGKNLRYTWQLPDGGPIGRCLNDNCAAMAYTFPAAGSHRKHTGGGNAFEVAVLASNHAGIVRIQTHVHVKYCGCTDPFDPSFDPDADYMVPRDCSRQQSWAGAPSELPRGQSTPFQVHFDPQHIFGVEVTVRIDCGALAMCYSTKHVPENFGVTPAALFDHPFESRHGTWSTHIQAQVHQAVGVPAPPPPAPAQTPVSVVVPGSEVDGEHCTYGVSMFKVLTVPYARLAPNRRQKRENTPPSSIYVALKGTSGFTRFELLARPLSFDGVPRVTLGRDKTAIGPHTTGVVAGSVIADKWVFHEAPLGRLGLADLEIRLTASASRLDNSVHTPTPGCVSLYSSWDEVWPSPMRATSSSVGYERTMQAVGSDCASDGGTGAESSVVWTAINPLTEDARRTLSIGITGLVTTAGEPSESDFRLEVIRHDYTGYKKPLRLLEGMTAVGSMQTSTSSQRVLGNGKLDFFEVHAAGTVALIQLSVRVGQVKLLCATAGLPTRGRYAKQWTLTTPPAHGHAAHEQQHSVLVNISSNCGMPADTADTDPYFWSEDDVSNDDELRQRVSLRGHASGPHGERSSVYLSVLGVASDLNVGTEGNVYEISAATELLAMHTSLAG